MATFESFGIHNNSKLSRLQIAHMSVIEALMVLYAREVVTLDRVSAAAQRFGTSQPLPVGSSVPHEDGLLCWINAACAALNKAEVHCLLSIVVRTHGLCSESLIFAGCDRSLWLRN